MMQLSSLLLGIAACGALAGCGGQGKPAAPPPVTAPATTGNADPEALALAKPEFAYLAEVRLQRVCATERDTDKTSYDDARNPIAEILPGSRRSSDYCAGIPDGASVAAVELAHASLTEETSEYQARLIAGDLLRPFEYWECDYVRICDDQNSNNACEDDEPDLSSDSRLADDYLPASVSRAARLTLYVYTRQPPCLAK